MYTLLASLNSRLPDPALAGILEMKNQYFRMKGSRESSRFPAGAAAEGERENSQVKGSASDETLKSGHLPLAAPKRQPRPAGETFRLMTEAQIIVLRLCFFIFGKEFAPDKDRGPVIGPAKPIKGGELHGEKNAAV